MKRIVSLLLCIVMMLSFLACDKSEEAEDTEQEKDKSEFVQDSSYSEIECHSYDLYSKKQFAFDGDAEVFSVTIPNAWELEKTENGFDIKLDGDKIGRIVKSKSKLKHAEDVWVYEDKVEISNFSSRIRIYRELDGENKDFYFNLRYSYKTSAGEEHIFYIETPYYYAGKSVQTKLLNSPEVKPISTESNLGMLKSTRYPSILILGNSFVNTSCIGDIIEEMGDIDVRAVSIGYATVARDEGTYIELISYNNFDYVFLCGFYSTDALEPTGRIADACKAAGSQLVIFPAHNESASAISAVSKKYPDIPMLDWKAEIDALISSGVSREHMCFADTHSHSTEIAGYVGAHMIYRALFGKLPPAIGGGYSWLELDVKSILGDYPKTASVKLIDEKDILYFS